MENYTPISSKQDREGIESNGIILCMNEKGRKGALPDIDIVYPYIILSLNLCGSSHSLYDMKEIRARKNDLTVFLPGHIIRPLEHSEDYAHAWLLFDPSKFKDSEMKFNSNDMELLSQCPICHLTDEQAENLLLLLGAINYIASRSEEELPNKHRLLEQQLSVTYELYMSIRHEQDTEWNKDRMGHIYLTFCNLVVEHHKEERNVNYYAKLLGYDPRYFSKIFRAYNDGTSPLEWIQNYVTNQAKRMISEHPEQSIKEVSIQLGFPTTANFCRYFLRATGIYPQAYKEALSTSEDA